MKFYAAFDDASADSDPERVNQLQRLLDLASPLITGQSIVNNPARAIAADHYFRKTQRIPAATWRPSRSARLKDGLR